jgi:hypothetical protein
MLTVCQANNVDFSTPQTPTISNDAQRPILYRFFFEISSIILNILPIPSPKAPHISPKTTKQPQPQAESAIFPFAFLIFTFQTDQLVSLENTQPPQ